MDQSGEGRKQTSYGVTHVNGYISIWREFGVDRLIAETLAACAAAKGRPVVCGIADWSGALPGGESYARRLAHSLCRRGLDAHAVGAWPEAPLGRAHLSIIDLPATGAQPMANEGGNRPTTAENLCRVPLPVHAVVCGAHRRSLL
jgi:hypothetical protein